jgi:hypothetical protein
MDNAGFVSGYRGSKSNGPSNAPAQSDPDTDGDGIKDRLDAFPFDATRSADRDQDGAADVDDAFPDNASEQRDSDGGGLGDNADLDDDNDGTPDASDALPLDPRDGADADQDGIGDSQDAFAAEPREDRDTDGDGVGDRADADDDGDGTIDLGSGATLAESELLVADGATDRILRFRGSDLAPLGTLVTLGAGTVTRRTGMASAPGGELWFVAGSSLMRLDRLRGELRRMVDAYAEPQIDSGFPMTPVLAGPDSVSFSELPTARLFTTPRWRSSSASTPTAATRRGSHSTPPWIRGWCASCRRVPGPRPCVGRSAARSRPTARSTCSRPSMAPCAGSMRWARSLPSPGSTRPTRAKRSRSVRMGPSTWR